MKLFPNTDFQDLRDWLDKRAKSLKNERLPHERFWIKLSDHFEPDLGRALRDDSNDVENKAAAPRDEKILTSTPRTEFRRMAAAMKSGTANESRQWFRLRLKGKGEKASKDQPPSWTSWLDELTRSMSSILDKSNAYGAIGRLFQHTILFGTGAALVLPDDENVINIRVIDTGAFWVSSSRGNERIDTLLRRTSMTAREIMEEFGEKRCPADAARSCETGSDETRYTIWNLITPNDKNRFPDLHRNMTFASIYWTESKNDCGDEITHGVIDIRGFNYNPILCPRWEIIDEGIYGSGPGRIGLPDVMELYRLEKDSLKAIALRGDPALAAPESMRGLAINTYPGGITYYPDGMTRDHSIHNLIDDPGDIAAIENKIQQVEMRLRRVFYADLFNAILNTANNTGVQMTARQVDEMSGEKISLLGPILTNLNHGMFDPCVDSVFAVMVNAGRVPEPPPGLDGQEFQAEYVSTLHMRQQEEARLGGIIRFNQFASGVLTQFPDSVHKIDGDQMLDEAATALAVPGSVIRSDADADKRRAAIAEEKQRQQEALQRQAIGQQVPGYADAVQKLSETPTGGTTALEALIGARQPTNGGMV